MKLTQKVVREYVRILGGTFRRTPAGDLKVKFGEDEYFTDDLNDAIGTARIMKGSHPDIDRAEEYLREETQAWLA